MKQTNRVHKLAASLAVVIISASALSFPAAAQEMPEEEKPIPEESIISEETEPERAAEEEYYFSTSQGGCYDPSGTLYFNLFDHGCLTVSKDNETYGMPVFIIHAMPDAAYHTSRLEATDEYGEDTVIAMDQDFIAIPVSGYGLSCITARFETCEDYYFETSAGGIWDESGHFYIESFEHGRLTIRKDYKSYDTTAYVIEAFPQTGFEITALEVTDTSHRDAVIERFENGFALDQSLVELSRINLVFENTEYSIAISCPERNADIVCAICGEERDTAHYGDIAELTVKPHSGFRVKDVRVSDDEGTIISCGSDEYLSFEMPESNVTVTVECEMESGKNVMYMDENGEVYSHACWDFDDVPCVEGITIGATGMEIWYAVTRSTVFHYRLTVEGNVNLILCDGAALEIKEGIFNDGRLTIWSQSYGSDMGRLTCGTDSKWYCAGIGGNQYLTGKLLYIHGGNIESWGGRYAAGIGGGQSNDGGNINIYGGKVTAHGGVDAAGIGGGESAEGGTINIYGGTVKAYGNDNAAGIGGGQDCNGGTISIYGGDVYAEAESYSASDYFTAAGAGIGGGEEGIGGHIRIYGGNITAKGGKGAFGAGAGIGGGDNANGGIIDIYGGTISAKGGACGSNAGAGIGGGNGGEGGTITIRGGDIKATGGYDTSLFVNGSGAGIGGGDGAGAGAIRIVSGTITAATDVARSDAQAAGIGAGYYGGTGSVEMWGGNITSEGYNAIGGGQRGSDVAVHIYSDCSPVIEGGIFERFVRIVFPD